MTRPRSPKSLHDKIVAACDAVGVIPKKGKNSNYNYQRASDVAAAFRHELFKRGVLLIPDELECTQEKLETNGGGIITQVTLKTEYILTDGTTEKRYKAFGCGRDVEDKAIYKAKTGSVKYFLRILGLIPDEESDPEFEHRTDGAAAQPAKGEKPSPTLKPYEIKGLSDACAKSGKTVAQACAHLGVKNLGDLPRKHFKTALKWANQSAVKVSGGRAEDAEQKPALHDASGQTSRSTAMTPPEPVRKMSNDEARAKLVSALLSPENVGKYIEPANRKPQEIVRVMDAEPEFRLRGY